MPVVPRVDVTITYEVEEQICNNVLHYNPGPTPPSQTTIQGAADAVANRFAPVYKAVLSTLNQFVAVEVRYLSATLGRYAFSRNGAGAGAVSGQSLPSGDAVVLRKIGTGPARRAQGNAYISGVLEGSTSESKLTVPAVTAYEDICIQMEAELFADMPGSTPVVLSRTALELYPITDVVVTPIIGHLRRRRPANAF